jgi:hypothetical protein
MFALTVTCFVAAIEPLWGGDGHALIIGLVVIAAGTVLTVVRRTRTLAARLQKRENGQ